MKKIEEVLSKENYKLLNHNKILAEQVAIAFQGLKTVTTYGNKFSKGISELTIDAMAKTEKNI